MVTTYTLMSTSYPDGGGTWSLSSTVRESASDAVIHAHAMGRDMGAPTIGWTSRSTRYSWEAKDPATGVRIANMVIIVPDHH